MAKMGGGQKCQQTIQGADIHFFLPENSDCFIEDQAFSPSYDLALHADGREGGVVGAQLYEA